jgi:hypothetical protein
VIANFLRIEGATWAAWRIPTAVFSVLETGATTFLSSSSSIALRRLSGPLSRPTTFFFLLKPGIEPGSPDLQPGTLTTRPQRRCTQHYGITFILWVLYRISARRLVCLTHVPCRLILLPYILRLCLLQKWFFTLNGLHGVMPENIILLSMFLFHIGLWIWGLYWHYDVLECSGDDVTVYVSDVTSSYSYVYEL